MEILILGVGHAHLHRFQPDQATRRLAALATNFREVVALHQCRTPVRSVNGAAGSPLLLGLEFGRLLAGGSVELVETLA